MPADTLAKHVCPQCNNVYNSATYLELHIKSKHELKPDLKCDFCDFKTLSTQKLNTHKKTVHNVSRFKCHLCMFQSRTKDDLTRHTISNHLCNICDFTAEKRQDLLEHHQNLHKLKCGQCELKIPIICSTCSSTDIQFFHYIEAIYSIYSRLESSARGSSF